MNATQPFLIHVEAIASYVPEQSDPDAEHYVFTYRIMIRNDGLSAARLIARHWYITDASGRIEEVAGEGVIGEQPFLTPGAHFEYTSGCTLPTPFGSMRGTYLMSAEDGTEFEADIPEFLLVGPRTLH